MKLFPLSVLLFFCCSCVLSQTEQQKIKVQMSVPYENDHKRTFVSDMYLDSTGHIYIVKSEDKMTAGEVLFGSVANKNPTVLIEKYTPDLQQVYSYPMQIGDVGNFTTYYRGVYVVNRRPYYFSSNFNKEDEMGYLYRHELGENGKLVNGVKIAEMESNKGGGRFNIIFSPDSTLLAVVSRPAVKSKKTEELSFRVFDGHFRLVREGAATFPYINRDMEIKGLALTNQGDFSVLISYEHDRDSRKFAQELFVFPVGESTPRRVQIELRNLFLLDFQVVVARNGDLYGVGLYNEISQREKIKNGLPPTSLGTAWIKIDHTDWKPGKAVLNPYLPTTRAFMESRSKMVYGYGFQYFRIFKTWLSDEGRVYLDMEQDWTTETEGRSLHSVNRQSEMIVLIGYDTSGKVVRETIVPHKITGGGTSQGLYHIALKKGDKFRFIYNDNAKNFRKEFKTIKDIDAVVAPGSTGIALKSKKPKVVMCTVDGSGTKIFDSIFDFEDTDVFLHTPDVLDLGAGRLLVAGSHGRDFRLFKLEIRD
ncbi:MAG: hypothetical protein KA165_03355 [Saprospiraceae bacterium]|nr:hypothetical protein [Saprospiraceae bacterium]